MSRESIAGCVVCGSGRFELLPAPGALSMTTAGILLQQPLSKEQCMECGVLARRGGLAPGETDLYEKNYRFFERPGAAVFDPPRYEAMADWIAGALGKFQPDRILDAGCGRGWMMRALRTRFPRAEFHGVEPSEQESEFARRDGWSVDTGLIDENYPGSERYDLVYCTNVLEHTTDPEGFLKRLGELVSPAGRIVITCPDSSYASAEFMFADQKFSFLPAHVLRLAEGAGLYGLDWRPAPNVSSLRDKQLWVLGRSGAGRTPPWDHFRSVTPGRLFSERAEYVAGYEQCDRYLEEAVRGADRVYNFGTSTWSMLLRAYCPAYWQRVTACAIDGGCGEFQGRPVIDLRAVRIGKGDRVVLGVNPENQATFAKLLEASGVGGAIGWSHLISR